MRNRRVTSREAETNDLFSSSLIFGNVGGGSASTQQQQSSHSSFSAGTPYLLDGSGGSRRSPGSTLKSPGQTHSEAPPQGSYPSSGGGGMPVRNNRPPITSLIDRQARGGSSVDRHDSHRSPYPSAMDRTHMSMSVAQSPYGDISFASDNTNGHNGAFGAYSGGFNVDSSKKGGRMQTPYARKGRFGYTDDDEDDRSLNTSGATPLWARDGGLSVLSSGGRSGERVEDFPSSGGRDASQSQGGQNSRMMLHSAGGGQFNSFGGEAFDQLEASWLCWVVVSGVPLKGSSSASSSVSKVLMRMQQFGDIVEHTVSNGNWMFLKFSSPFQAERAACDPIAFLGSGLDSHVMLSITRLTSQIARSLNLQIDSNGALTQGGELGLSVTSPFPSSRHTEREARQVDGLSMDVPLRGALRAGDKVKAEEYLRPPKKRGGSVCTRLIEYIFSY